MSGKKSRKVRIGSSRQRRRNQDEHEANKDDDGSEMSSKERKVVEVGTDSVSVILQTDLVSPANLSSITQQYTERNNPPLNELTESHLSQPVNPCLLKSPDTAGKRRKMGSTRQNKSKQEQTDFGEKEDAKTGDTKQFIELQASIAVVESGSQSNTEELLGPKESEMDTECRRHSEFLLIASNTFDQLDDRCKEEVGEGTELSREAAVNYSSELQSTPSDSSLGHDKSAQSESRRRKMGSTRRNPRDRHEEEEDGASKMHRYRYLYDEGEEGDGAINEKNEGEERNEESVLTGLSCSFSSSSQEGRNVEADNIESESQSIIKESMAAKLILLRESELTELSQTLHNPYPDVPTIESYDSYLTDDTLNSNPAITGLQHKETLIEETLDESRENTDSPPDPPSLQSSLGPEETAKVESYTPGKKRKIGSTRSKTHQDRKGGERREEGKEEEKGEDTEGIGEGGDVMIAVEMESSSIEKTELVELEELTKEQAMGDPETIVMEGEVNKVAEGESGIEKSELVKHTEKVREAEEIEVEVKIVTESESSQTPSGTAALTVEAEESGDMVCIEPHISSQYMEHNDLSLNDLTESKLSQTGNPYLIESPDTAGKRRKMGSTRRNKGKQEEPDFVEKEDAKTGDTEQSLELQASIAVVESGSHSNTKELLGPKEIEMDTECRSQSEVLLFSSNTLHQPDDICKEEVCEDTEPSSEAVVSYSSEFLQNTLGTESLSHLPLDLALQVVQGFAAEPITGELKKEGERRQESESEHAEAESSIFHSSRHSLDQSLESDTLTNTEEFESFNNTIILQSGEGEEKLEPVVNESELQDDINSTGPGNQETLHQRDEAEDVVDLIVEENIVLAYRPHFRQPDHVESYQPEQCEDITCFLQSTPSDSSLGHDKSAQSESRRRKMDSTSRNPRGRHEEEEDGESKMHRYRYLYDEGEEVILGKEEMFGIEETEFEMSMEPKGSASGDEKEGEQMETEEDTENIQETGERLELDMGTVEGSGVETLEESLMLLEQEHRADEEKKGMDEGSLIEPTPFDQDIDSFGIADQLHNQEKGNQVTVETVNTETESNNEASMAHIVDPIERFSVGLDQSGDTLLSEEEVSDFTLLVNESEVSKSSQITCDRALKIESDGTLSTDPKISPSQLIQTPCMEITNPFLNPLLLQSIQGNEEDANTDSNTTVGLDTSEVILLREEEVSDRVLLVNEVSVSSQITYDDRTLTTEPCQTDEALITDPSISVSKLNQTPYSDESHNSFLNPLLLQSVQDQGVNAANRDSNQSPSPSRRRKMGSIRRHPPGAQKEELGKEEKQEGEIESIEDLEDKGEDIEAVEGSYIEFEMLMESKDGTGNEKNEGEERNEESVLTGLSCSFSSSSQEGRNIEADNIESESQSIIKESMAAKLILLRESELTELSQILHNPYPDVPTIESYDSYLTDDTLNSNPAITGLQHKETLIEETLDESRENTDSPPDPPSLQSSLGPEETAKVESYTPGKKRKIGSTRSKTHRDRKGGERREEGKEEEKGEDTEGIGEGGDVMIAVEMESSSIEKTELVELEELLEKVTKEQAMGDPETIVMEGEVNIVAEEESGIEKSELVKHTEKVREAEEIEVEVKIVTESESSQTPSGTAALTVEAQESGDMVCIEPHISSQYMEDNDPSLNDLTESKLSQTGNPYLIESPDTAGKRRKMGSTRRNKGKQEETDFVEKEDAKTGDTEQSLELQASIAVVESGSHSNTKELLGPKEIEMDTECRSQSEVLLFSSNTLHQPDDTCKEEVCEDTEPSSEAVASYSSEFLQDALGTESLSHLPLDLALQVVQGFAAEPITGELKKEGERRQESESEHAEAESSIFHSSRHSLDQSLESDTLTNTEEFESFNNTIILQSGEGEEKLEPVVNESELQDDINSTGPGNQETLHQRDEAEDVVDLIVEENIVLAYRPHFRQPDQVESYQPEQSEDITCFLQSTPSDSSLGHDKSAQSESRRRKMDSTSRNPRGRHEEEEDGESKMHRYRYLYDEGEEVILGKEEMFGIEETEFEMSMEPKGSASGDEKEGEQMETEEDTENIQETGERLELDMGTVEGSGVETLEESLMLLEQEHRADEEKKGMDEGSLIEPTPFDQDIDSFGIADQLHNQEKGNQVTVETVNTETESNNEASMAHIVDPIERFSVGLDQSGDTLLSEEEVSDFTLLVNESEVSKSSQITCDRALKIESDGTLSTDPKISPSQLIQTPCMEITNPFLNPLLLQSIQGNEEDANTDSNTTVGLDTSEVILLREEEVSDRVLLVNEVSVSSQITYDDRTLTTEPCQTDEALITDPSISVSKLNQTPYSDESHNSFLNPLLLQSVQDQGVNAANRDSNQSPSPSRRRKMGSIRRHPPGAQKEELGKEEKQEGEIESIEDLEDKGEDIEAVEGSYIEFEMLMESKDGTGNEKNEGEERNEESVLTGLSCSFSSSSQEGRNIEADNIESESQSIIKESMAAKLILLRESELTELSQILHNPYPDVPTIESYDSYLTDDTLNSNPAITGLQHKETLIEETLDESRENTDSPPDPPSLQSSLGPEETAKVESYTPGKKRKIGSTRSKTHRDRKGGERREEGKEEEKGEDTEGIGEGGDVMIAVEMESSSIEKTELVELEELLEKVTKEQAMGDPETIVMEGEVNIVAEEESGIEKSELVKHTEKVREAEEIEVEVKIVTESESSQTPSGTAALTVEAQESGDMVCIEPHISSQYMEDNDPSLNDLTESKLSQTGNPYLIESPDTAGKRRKMGSTRRNKGKQEETDFVEKEDAKTGDTEQSLELQASIAVVESGSHSNTKELLGPKEIEMDTECRSQSEVLLFSSNTLHQPDDTCKEEVCEDTEPSSEAVASYSSEFLQDALGTESLSHLPLDLALQVVQGFAAEPITGELKKEGERRQESESEHAEAESSIFHSSRHSLDQSLESDTLTNTEEFESFNNTIILQSGEGEEKLEPVVNESELQDDINSTGPGNQETLHQRDEAEDVVDLIVEENIVLAYRPHFRQPDQVESYQPEQSEDITCFLQSTPSDSSLGHDKSAQSESRRRKMDSTSRNPRGRHEEEEDGESKMHRYRYLYDEGEEVILGKEEIFGIEETEFEMSMEPKGSASGDEKEGEQMETEEDTENIQETGERLELDMGTVEGSGVETLEESLMLLEQEHRADEEKKGMDEESLIEPTPFDQDIDSFGIVDQLHNQEKGNQVTVETVNTETESNNEASMAHIVDPIERFSVGLYQSGDTLLSEEEVSDFTLLVNESEVSKSSQITCDRALKIESDGTLSTDPKISPSQLIQTPCMEITNPFLNPLLLQSIQGNVEDANTDSNTTVGLDTSEVILLREEEVSDRVLLVNEVSVSSQMTYDDRTLTTEPCQTDEALITDPSISGSKLNQTPYSDESHNSFLNPLLLQSVQDQGVNAANRDSNQSPSPSRRRKMGSIRRHPPGAQKEELGKEEKQEGEIESIEDLEDKGEDMEAVEGSYIEFEMLMESKDGTGNEKNEGEDRNEESVLTGLSCSFSSSSQEGRNIEADNIESESQSIIKESMAAKLILLRESELTELSQTLHNPYPDVPTIESYDSYLTDDTLNSNPAITGLQHKETLIEETLDESRENTDSPPDPPSLQSSLGPEETAKVESYTPGKKRKIGSTRSKTHRDRKGGERREERKEEEKGEDTEGIGEGGDVMIAVEMESSSIEKTELVELEELLEKVTKEQAMGAPETIVMEGEVNIVAEEESGIEKSELVKHTEKVREAEEIEVEVKIVTESESSQTPSGTAALTVEAQESGDMVCIEPHISSQYMEDNDPSLNDLTESKLSQTGNPYLIESPDTAGKRRKMGSTRRNKGKQEETDFVEKEDAKTGDTEQSLELQASIAVVESGSHSNTKELLGPKEIEMDTECRSQSEVLLFSSNTLHQPDDTCKEEVCEDTEPSSEAVASYSSEFLQDALGTESLSHLPLDLALQVVQGFAAEPITGELKKEGERRQESESEHAEAESSIFHSSRHSLDQSLESDTLTNTEEFESFNNTIILQSGEGEEKLEPVVNESELQDDINSTGPGNQETLHQRDEAEDVVDLIVEENIVLAYRPHFRQPDQVESYQPEQSEDITCFLQSTPSDSSLGHDKSAQSESRRRKMDSTSRNPRGRHEEEEDGESKMHRYRYLYDEGEEVILGKEEIFGIEETEFEMSMEPKGSASGDEKEGEQMETEEDTENIQETGERLELDMGTVEGSGVETLEESLMLLEQEHRADEEKKGMDEGSLIEPTPFDQDIDSFGIADQLHNQEKGNQVTVETVNTETESNNEASMAHIVDPIERFSVGLDQSGDTLLSEEEVSDFTLLVNESEVSKSSQITCDRALKIESDGTLSTDPKISPSQLIQTPCMEITNPFLNPLLLQSIQGNEEDANTDSNTTVGLDTSEVILLREEEVSDRVLLVNEVSVSSQITYDDRTLTTEPCQTDEALITDPSISGSKLNQTPYSDESHNSFLNPLLLQSVQDQGVNAANRDSNQSPSPSRRRKMGSIRRHPPGAQKEELGKEEKQEGEIESIEDLEDKGEDIEAVEGSYIEFEMLMESKDGTGNEKNEGEERNEESVLTGLSCSFSSSSQEGRNIEADNIESESQSIIKESMAAKLILLRESELTELSQTLHNPYPDVPTIESYDSYLTEDTLNSNPAITGLQHKETLIEETLDESRENTDSPPDPPSLQSSLGPEETAKVESYTPGKKRKIGSTRSKTHRDRKGGERREEGKEEEKGEDTEGIGEGGDVMIAVEMESSSIEKTELAELEELLEKVTKEQAMGAPETIVMEGEVNIVAEEESGIEKSELVKHTEKVREAEEIEVEVKIVTESESSQTPSGTAALTVEFQESGDRVCLNPHISAIQLTQTAYMEQRLLTPSNSPNLPSKSSLSLSSQSQEDVNESIATGKRITIGSTHLTRGGLHTEEETQETGENVTEAEVRAEAFVNPEVNAVLERFQEEIRGEAVSLEDQQETQSLEKETILIEVVASSTALSGRGSEQVAPAPQPVPGNQRGEETAERVEKGPVTREKNKQSLGTFGSSGSKSNPYNVVMVGNSSVGKTSFMRRFQSGEFCLHHNATIGIDTCIQPVTVDASPVTLQLWDTAGQERFHSITRQVFHKAQGLLLMYDITSSQSFRDVRYWVNCIQEGAPDDVIIMLLGNKTDCVELEREVQTHEGENLAKGYDMLFMECSAATGDNVTLSMETLARMLKQLGEETRQEEGSLVLQKESPKKKSGCC